MRTNSKGTNNIKRAFFTHANQMIEKNAYILIVTMMEIKAFVDSYKLDGRDFFLNYESTSIVMESMIIECNLQIYWMILYQLALYHINHINMQSYHTSYYNAT